MLTVTFLILPVIFEHLVTDSQNSVSSLKVIIG